MTASTFPTAAAMYILLSSLMYPKSLSHETPKISEVPFWFITVSAIGCMSFSL